MEQGGPMGRGSGGEEKDRVLEAAHAHRQSQACQRGWARAMLGCVGNTMQTYGHLP